MYKKLKVFILLLFLLSFQLVEISNIDLLQTNGCINVNATISNNCPKLKSIYNFIFNKREEEEYNLNKMLDNKVYLGGDILGFSIHSSGALVVGTNTLRTTEGEVYVIDDNQIIVGDLITSINNEKIEKVTDISNILNSDKYMGKEAIVKGIRKNKSFLTKLKPVYDLPTKKYKLGIWVKDNISGIGTVTYIKQNKRFGALGHCVEDVDTDDAFPLGNGNLVNCKILGISKGEKGKAGEIKGLFYETNKTLGVLDKNTKYGIYGDLSNENLLKGRKLIEICPKNQVKPGSAKIVSCITGKLEEYDIEIIKTKAQKTSNTKSMVLKIKDEKLLGLSGGIVQGMSGSPIIQNGKLVGAITHVFLDDPTKGFGIYIDWMLNN